MFQSRCIWTRYERKSDELEVWVSAFFQQNHESRLKCRPQQINRFQRKRAWIMAFQSHAVQKMWRSPPDLPPNWPLTGSQCLACSAFAEATKSQRGVPAGSGLARTLAVNPIAKIHLIQAMQRISLVLFLSDLISQVTPQGAEIHFPTRDTWPTSGEGARQTTDLGLRVFGL